MNFIFYWKNKYFKEEYPLKDFKLYSWYPPKTKFSSGDVMWVVTKYQSTYLLVGKFIIVKTKKELNPKHGDFCIISNKNKSIYFKLDNPNQKKFRTIFKNLKQWSNNEIGVYFHGKKHIQILKDSEHKKIELFSEILVLL